MSRAPAVNQRENRSRVLVAGVYLLDQPNNVVHIVGEMRKSSRWNVVQKWTGLGEGQVPEEVSSVTVRTREDYLPKFTLVNQLLADEDLDTYDYVVVSDDDISLPGGFIDGYLGLVQEFDLALAQPARAAGSHVQHRIVGQRQGLRGRRTRFVEIGPLFSLRRDLYGGLLPFNEAAPMGWGLDFVWPCIVERAGLRMGIVDAVPVTHRMREPAQHYGHEATYRAMRLFLARTTHLTRAEAHRVIERL